MDIFWICGPLTSLSKCFDHKTTFPETPRHFRPAIEISRKAPTICEGLQLKRGNQKTNMLEFAGPFFELFDFQTKVVGPLLKKQGYPMHNSELTLHLNCPFENHCVFTHGVQNTYISFVIKLYIFICKYIFPFYLDFFIYRFIIVFVFGPPQASLDLF